MKERPILMSAPMIRAILSGTKTQTRRVIKSSVKDCTVGYYSDSKEITPVNVDSDGDPWKDIPCPYGISGDRLWVRETWWKAPHITEKMLRDGADTWAKVYYAAEEDGHDLKKWGWKKKPSIHMPRWASRINLEITNIRVERLQDISGEDAKKEGVKCPAYPLVEGGWMADSNALWSGGFAALWESINGPGSWDSNPWVWVIEFKKL